VGRWPGFFAALAKRCVVSGNAAGASDYANAPLPLALQGDPNLARVVSAWPTLPEPIRRAVLALIEIA
jgi:hypothetical protein